MAAQAQPPTTPWDFFAQANDIACVDLTPELSIEYNYPALLGALRRGDQFAHTQ